MLLARGPHPPRFEGELSSGELLETATWPGISSRSSTTSKHERLIQPRTSSTPTSFLHIPTDDSRNPRDCQVIVECSSEAGQMSLSAVPSQYDRKPRKTFSAHALNNQPRLVKP